jgi:hypothetical protein
MVNRHGATPDDMVPFVPEDPVGLTPDRVGDRTQAQQAGAEDDENLSPEEQLDPGRPVRKA